jgi:hypothetical protein
MRITRISTHQGCVGRLTTEWYGNRILSNLLFIVTALDFKFWACIWMNIADGGRSIRDRKLGLTFEYVEASLSVNPQSQQNAARRRESEFCEDVMY